MKYIDLHVHSNASDGSLSPSEVVAYAASKNLEAIALTDHDTTAGICEALEAAKSHSIEVIPGIELSCSYKGVEIHILGLYVNHLDQEFCDRITELLQIRDRRNEEMIRRFSDGGMIMNMEELTLGNPNTVITRAHFARVLTAKGYTKSLDQAFKQYLQYGDPYCPPKEIIPPEHALALLTGCGAFPVLAHPLLYGFGYQELDTLIGYLKNLGLAGVEVYHSSNNQYESGRLRTIAKSYDLLPTGGSDFHGAVKPDIDIGTGRGGLRISSLLLDDIKKCRAKH